MEIRSRLFGKQTIDPDTIITFPQGLPGFEDQTRYKLFHQEGSKIIYWLQSLDDEDIIFSVTHPATFNINYQFTLTDSEAELLDLEDMQDLIILIMLHKEENADSQDKPTIKGSIKSPLLINGKNASVLPNIEQSIILSESSNEIDVSEA